MSSIRSTHCTKITMIRKLTHGVLLQSHFDFYFFITFPYNSFIVGVSRHVETLDTPLAICC